MFIIHTIAQLKTVFVNLLLCGLTLLLVSCSPIEEDPEGLTKIRLVYNPSGTQGLIPAIMEAHELDARYGFELVPVISAGSRGANFIAIKTGQADLMTTNWIDTAINRKGGVDVQVIQPFLKWANVFLTANDSPIQDLSVCRGLRIGVTNPNALDWTVSQLVTQRLYGFNIAEENEITIASSGLLNGLLEQGKLDLILQYSEPAAHMTASGGYRVVTEVSELMEAANLAPRSPLTCYVMTESLLDRYPEAATQFRSAYKDAISILKNDPNVDALVAAQFEISDPSLLDSTRNRVANSVFASIPSGLPAACQELFSEFQTVLTPDQLGLETLPDGLFNFE